MYAATKWRFKCYDQVVQAACKSCQGLAEQSEKVTAALGRGRHLKEHGFQLVRVWQSLPLLLHPEQESLDYFSAKKKKRSKS